MKQILIAFDQLLNSMLFFLPGGCWADETFSARSWRCRNVFPFTWIRPLIDQLLWFDPQHCYTSYLSEVNRTQEPPEERFAELTSNKETA